MHLQAGYFLLIIITLYNYNEFNCVYSSYHTRYFAMIPS